MARLKWSIPVSSGARNHLINGWKNRRRNNYQPLSDEELMRELEVEVAIYQIRKAYRIKPGERFGDG